MPSIDFTDVGEPEEWTPAPSGVYILELLEAEDVEGGIKSGPNKGKDITKLKFEIVDCEGDLEKYNGRTIYSNTTYGEKALPIVKQMLRAFGVEIEEGKPMEWDWDELIGAKLQARLRSVPPRKDKNDPSREYPAKNEISRFIVPDDDDEE
jgi:hypothetical protein